MDDGAPIQQQMAPVAELEAAIHRVSDAAVATARQRAAALVNLIPTIGGLLPLISGRLGADLAAARQAVGDLLDPFAQPRTTGEPIDIARQAVDAEAALRQAIEAVLTEAARQLPDWAADADALFAAIGRPGPLTPQQRSDLDAFISDVQNPPENGITRLDAGMVRQGMIAVTTLIAATSRELNPAALGQRAQAAIEVAEAALRLPGVGGQADGQDSAAELELAIRAARDAVGRLPERRMRVAEVDAFRQTWTR